MCREERVEERHVPERNITDSHVVITDVAGFDILESLYPDPGFGMQMFEDKSRGGVFLSKQVISVYGSWK